MYRTKVDLSKEHPLDSNMAVMQFRNRLSSFGEQRFSNEYVHVPTLRRCNRRLEQLKNLGIQHADFDLARTPDDLKYSTVYLDVYYSKGGVTAVFELQTGALNQLETDRCSLTIAGSNQKRVEDYLIKLFGALPKNMSPSD